MRLPNSYGSITKLSGKRRRPWMVRVTTEMVFNEETKKYRQKQTPLGYYATKAEAIQALADYNHDPYDLNGSQITFDEIFQKIEFTESTKRNYNAAYKYLNPVSDYSIRSIKPAQLQDCINECQTGQQPLIKTICRRVYNYALMHEYVDRDISQMLTAHGKETQIQRDIFTHDEVEELWTMTSNWWVKITLILLYSGMRTKELRTVELEMIDFDNEWVDFTKGKNKFSIRGIPIHSRVLPLLRDYVINGGNLYGYTHSNLNRCLKEYHGHRAHDTRHTFTTRMRECGVDQLTVKRLLGHTPSDITERVYTHISPDELKEAISKLEY